MVHVTPGDSPKLPVEQLARFLLECAKADPALLARSNPEPLIAAKPLARPVPITLDGLLALKPGSIRTAPEMEELVSIAVACARRAEDALRHAHEVSRVARRRMSMVAALSGACIAAGVVVIVLDRNRAVADPRLTEVASAVRGVSDLQKETVAQLADVQSNVAAMRDHTLSTQPAPPPEESAPITVATAVEEPTPVAVATAGEPTPVAVATAEEPAPLATTEPNQAVPEPIQATDTVPPRSQEIQARPQYHRARHVAHVYRRAVWRGSQQPGLPIFVTQVFAGFRRNLDAIFR